MATPKATTITLGEMGPLFENDLLGVNLELTRKQIFAGLSAQMLNNRKLYAGQEFPAGWECSNAVFVTDRKEESLCGSNFVILKDGAMSQTSAVIATKTDKQYEAKVWVKALSDTAKISFGLKNQEKAYTVCKDTEKYQEVSFVFDGVDIQNGTFCVAVIGEAMVFEVSLMPTDHFYNMRRDVIEALRYIAPTSIRFPGGCAADHFDWQQSLKSVEFREPMHCENKWQWFLLRDTYDQDCLDIGLNEFMMLCRALNAEPEYTISLFLPDGEDARRIVEYCNGDATTEYGAIRESLGFSAFNIKLWYVGNEPYLFGEEYREDGALTARRTSELIHAMRKADKNIQTVIGLTWSEGFREWSHDFIASFNCPYDFVSHHYYIGDIQGTKGKAIGEMLESNFADGEDDGLNFYKNELFAERFDNIEICADEWNYYWDYGSNNGLFFSNALHFHFFAKSGEKYHIRKARFFAPVNEGMITVKGADCTLESTGELFKMMAHHKGGTIIHAAADSSDIDVLCTDHGDTVFMTVVNRKATAYAIEVADYAVESCKQILVGEASFESNDFTIETDAHPIVAGHSVVGMSLRKL